MGQTATLIGRVTNETGFPVSMASDGPFAVAFDLDGSRPILRGDFSSPPSAYPDLKDAVLAPGGSLDFRSVPVTLLDTSRRWDGSGWKPIVQFNDYSTMTYCQQRSVPSFHIVEQ